MTIPKYPIIFVFILLFSFSAQLSARTRDEVLAEAENYANVSWPCNSGNIIDENGDGADDRTNWSFTVGSNYIGEAYCYGHWDMPAKFLNKLGQNYIAGNAQTKNTLPDGHAGFTGIDTNGFLSRIIGITDMNLMWMMQNISKYCVRITNPNEIQQGDFLMRADGIHFVLYGSGDIYSNATIYHATNWSYATGGNVRRVMKENCQCSVSDKRVYLKDNSVGGQLIEHFAYTPFPVFMNGFYPAGTIKATDSSGLNIKVLFTVKSNLKFNSIEIKVDGISIDPKDIVVTVSGAVPSGYEISHRTPMLLTIGNHTVSVKITNEAGLESLKTQNFVIISGLQ